MGHTGATRSKVEPTRGATSGTAEQPDGLPLSEAAKAAGVSVQALRQRIKRGSLASVRLVVGGRVVVGVPRRELARVFGTPEVQDHGLAPGCSAQEPPRSNPEQGTRSDGATTADLIVLRSDYRAMLTQVKEQAASAEARELRARRALIPAVVGLVLATVAVSVTWTGWRGASVRASELAQEVPALRARAELLADGMLAAQLAVGEGALALERAELEGLQAKIVHDQTLAAELERRQRAETVVAWHAVTRLLGLH